MGCVIGGHTSIGDRCYFTGNKFEMGSGTYINYGCTLDCRDAYIVIGKKVGIGCNMKLISTSHKYSDSQKRAGSLICKDILIGDDCWIGGGVIICPGVSVGVGTVIAAGSVVINDLEANGLYAGNPAKLVKKLDVYEKGQ